MSKHESLVQQASAEIRQLLVEGNASQVLAVLSPLETVALQLKIARNFPPNIGLDPEVADEPVSVSNIARAIDPEDQLIEFGTRGQVFELLDEATKAYSQLDPNQSVVLTLALTRIMAVYSSSSEPNNLIS